MSVTEKNTQETKTLTGGLLSGAQILTLTGYVAIEELTEGMRIVTRRGTRVLRNLHKQEFMTRPIKISPNTLGFSRPAAGMFVVPGQQVLVRDWRAQALFGQERVILPIDRLIDDVLIYQADAEAMHDVYTLEFDDPEVFYADGVEVVSSKTAVRPSSAELTLAA